MAVVDAGATRLEPLGAPRPSLPARPEDPPAAERRAAHASALAESSKRQQTPRRRSRRAARQAGPVTWQPRQVYASGGAAPVFGGQVLLLGTLLIVAGVAATLGFRLAGVHPSWQGALVTIEATLRPLRTPPPAAETTPSNGPASFSGIAIRPLLPDPAAMTADAAPAPVYRPTAPEIVSAPARPWLDVALQQQIEELIPPDAGTVAVAVRHVTSGASAGVNADRTMPPASTYKLGVLLEAAREMEQGRLSLDEQILLLPEDWADGAGVLQGRIGEYVSVREALHLMIGISDNTAALALLRRLGLDAVNAGYDGLSLAHTHLYPDDRPDTTTAWELATLLTMVTSGQAAGASGTTYMLQQLDQPQPQAWIEAGTPPGTVVAHKSGQLPGVRNDAALVYTPSGPYAVVVLTDSLASEEAGEALISTISGAVYDHFAAWLGSVPLAADNASS